MVTTDDDVRALLPGHDCGLCGSPTCATFARRLVLSMAKPADCLPLDKGREPEITSLLSEGAVTGICENQSPRGTIAINPCADGGKVTLETQLKCNVKERGCSPFDLLDFQYLGGYLAGLDGAGGLSASLEMGYAKFDIAGQRVHLFKRGKLIVRRADSHGSAMGILSTVARAVWPSVICPDTGRTLSNSFQDQGCPVTWRPHEFSTPEAELPPVGTTVSRLPSFNAFLAGLPSDPSPPGRALMAEVGRAFSVLDSPSDAQWLLAAAGALEAMERAASVPDGWDPETLALALRGGKVLPVPAPGGDWPAFKSAYNMHLASLALLAAGPPPSPKP